MTPRLEAIKAVRLVAHDAERLVRFYAEALGAEAEAPLPIPQAEAAVTGAGERRPLRIGAQRLDIDTFAEPGAPYPSDIAADDARFQHVALVVAGIGGVFDHVVRCGARPLSRNGPVRLPASSGGATAVKLRDPEGHPFELIALAPGPWDDVPSNGRGVRGLDHSAITVRDIAASRRFYAGRGLIEREATVNIGPAQAALDGLDDPEVHVAPLFPPGLTPHLELLGYARTGGVGAPVGDRDVAATRIAWRAAGVSAPTLIRDPDGHRHLLEAA